MGAQGDGPIEIVDRRLAIAVGRPLDAAVVMGVAIVGLQRQGLVEIFDRPHRLVLGAIGPAAADQGPNQLGIEHQGLVVVGQGLVVISLVGPRRSPIVPGQHVLGIEPDGRAEIFDRLFVLFLLPPGHAANVPAGDPLGLVFDLVAVELDGPLDAEDFFGQHPASVDFDGAVLDVADVERKFHAGHVDAFVCLTAVGLDLGPGFEEHRLAVRKLLGLGRGRGQHQEHEDGNEEALHGLQFELSARLDHDRLGVRFAFHARGPGGGVLHDRRPGVVVRGHDAARLDQLDRGQRVVGAHRKTIADRQHGQVDALRADLLHVGKQGRVAGEINLAVGQRQQESARIAAVWRRRARSSCDGRSSFARGRRASVMPPPMFIGSVFLTPCFSSQVQISKFATTVAPVRLGDLGRVGHVVEMAVRNEDVVGRDAGRLDRRGGRVVEKRIDQDRLLAGIDQPGRMSQPGQLGHRIGLEA